MKPLVVWVLAALLCACTAQRIEQNLHDGLQWVRLSTSSRVEADNRWQFSPELQIELAEVRPGANHEWLGAARSGMSQIFPTTRLDDHSSARHEDLLLLIRWPAPAAPESESSKDDSEPAKFKLRLLPIEGLLPNYAETLDIHIFVIDAATDHLIQSATLDISPWWFSSDDARAAQIEQAFRRYAESLVTSR